MPYAIDLFCGAGGMSEGIIQAGFHILFSSDINQSVEETYKKRHEQLGYIQDVNTCFLRSDVRDLTGDDIMQRIRGLQMFTDGTHELPEEIDVIFGGPPCQGFSRAGKRDPNDPRNMLFREYLRLIREVNPRYVVMENVEGFNDTRLTILEGMEGVPYEDELVSNILTNELHHIGYDVLEPRVLNAVDYGVPQSRRRAIFIAYRQGEVEPCYPEAIVNENERVTVQQAIGDLIRDERIKDTINPNLTQYQIESHKGRTPCINGGMLRTVVNQKNLELSTHSPIIQERFSLYLEGETTTGLKSRIQTQGIELSEKIECVKLLLEKFPMYSKNEIVEAFRSGNATDEMIKVLLTKKGMRKRLHRDAPSLTVVTLPDDYISPFENRIFSVREMARLQSFDDSFIFYGPRTTGGERRKKEAPQYTQVGNAVPPLLARAVATEIMKAININDIELEIAN